MGYLRKYCRKIQRGTRFFHVVVVGHVLAAAMHFFGMRSISDDLSRNAPPTTTVTIQWTVMQHAVTRRVDHYVTVGGMAESSSSLSLQAEGTHPHAERTGVEHSYIGSHTQEHCRVLLQWMQASHDEPTTSQAIQKKAPDRIYNYASAVLNVG